MGKIKVEIENTKTGEKREVFFEAVTPLEVVKMILPKKGGD